MLAPQRQRAEVPDGDAHARGLLLDEGARAGGADLVHLEVGDLAALRGDILRVLPADFKDGVGRGTQTLAPGAGDAHAADGEGAVFVLQGVQPFAREAPPSGSPAGRRYKKSTSVLLSAARSESRVQGICAAQAAPMAAVWRAVSGTISSSASRWNTSRMARMTPALQVTPPVKTTGLWMGRLRTIVAL